MGSSWERGSGPADRAPAAISSSPLRVAEERRESAGGSAVSRRDRFRLTDDPRPGGRPYHQVVNLMDARLAGLPRSLGARVAALPPRRQERARRTLGLGVALAAVNVVSLLPYRAQQHPLWLALLLVVAQGLPLTWRRTWPIGVGLVIGGARVAYDQIGFTFAPFPLGPAIAFYTVIDRCGPVWRWAACVVAAVGIAVGTSAPGHHQPYDAIFQVMIFFTAWAAGTLSRTKRASLRAAQNRADRAEAELDRQAALAAGRERTRIARELHDVVAHHVSLIAVQAEAAASLLPGRPDQSQVGGGHHRRHGPAGADRAAQAPRRPARSLRAARRRRPSASLGELGEVLEQVRGAGPAGGLRGRGHARPAVPGRGPDRVPHRPGGADQHDPPRPGRPGRRDACATRPGTSRSASPIPAGGRPGRRRPATA